MAATLSRAAAALLALAGPAIAACSDRESDSLAAPIASVAATAVASPAPTATPSFTPASVPSPPRPPTPGPGLSPENAPWNRDVVITRSTDGLAFGATTVLVERAGVPNVIRDTSGRLIAVFQWFPFDRREAFDRVAVAFSLDEGATWSAPFPLNVTGLPGELTRPFDPTIVELPDGRFRLYFTSNQRAPGASPAIYSAIGSAVDGSFAFEPGARFAPSGGTVDASIVFFRGAWQLFSHTQQANTGRGFHAASADGLTFAQEPDLAIGQGRQWIGNAVVSGDRLRYYGSGAGGVWSATSADGSTWILEEGVRLNAGDPSAVVLGDGTVLLAAVGPVRPDAGPAPFTNP